MSIVAHRRAAAAPTIQSTRPANAFVLSGGGSAGAAQVGMLRALLEAGVKPDVVIGCSVGALNAASLAVDPSLSRVDDLERMWLGLDRGQVFGAGRRQPLTNLLRRECYLYEPAGLHRVIRQAVPLADLSQTAIPCHVVTTDLDTGQPRFWSHGDPVQVLSASACLPGIFPPVQIDGSLHVDGGVACPLPVDQALHLQSRTTWAMDVSGGSIGRRGDRMTALDVLLLSFSISRSLLNRPDEQQLVGQTVVRLPRVDLGRHDMRDFSRTAELIELGYAATRAHLDEIGDIADPDSRPSVWRRIPLPRRNS